MERWQCAEGCGDLVVISTRGGDGSEVTLRACGRCGSRSWSRNGRPMPLRVLLDELARPAVELLRAS